MINQKSFFDNAEEEISLSLDVDKELDDDNEEHGKVISLKTNEYIFDVNTLFLPFVPEYKGDKIQKIEVQQANSKIVVRGDAELGVPTVYDKTTFTALQKIFLKQRSIDNKINFKTKNITEEDRIIKPFTITELAREMGYTGNIGTNIKANICDSIRRISYTTYVSSSDRTFDHKNQEYLMRAEEGIHLIKYKMLTITDKEKEIRRKQAKAKSNNPKSVEKYNDIKERVFEGMIQITLDEVVYKAMASEQILYYKDRDFAKIKHNYSKSIYMLALKLAGKDKECKMSLNKILTYFPPKPGLTDAKAKELTKKALNRISDSKACTISYLNNDVIYFSFKKNAKVTYEFDYMTNKFNTFGEMLQGFINLGLTQEEVFSLNMQNQRYYEALVRYATIRNAYNNLKKPRDFVLSYIENEFPIDEKYYTKQLNK